jgi:hypothetical protein
MDIWSCFQIKSKKLWLYFFNYENLVWCAWIFFEEIFKFFIDYMSSKVTYMVKKNLFKKKVLEKIHLNLNSSLYKYFWGFSYFITIKILITLKICILVEVHLHTMINFIWSCFIFLSKLFSTSSMFNMMFLNDFLHFKVYSLWNIRFK